MGEPVTVHAALSSVMNDVQAVGKDSLNKAQGFSFRGVDAVVNAVGPALRTHGLIVMPRILDKSYQTFETAKGALMHECIVEVEYTFTGPDGSQLVCSAVGESADSGDKSTAKAMSVAYRTMWLQALCIPTDDPDPDGHTYERSKPVELVSAGQAKRRLIEASDEATAVAVWSKRGSDPIHPAALEALLDVAREMKEHEMNEAENYG